MSKVCSEIDCAKAVSAKGYCNRHYLVWKRALTPEAWEEVRFKRKQPEDESLVAPVSESKARGRTCRRCGDPTHGTSYWYCLHHMSHRQDQTLPNVDLIKDY